MRSIACAAMVAACGMASAQAPAFEWSWNRGDSGVSINDNAGRFSSVYAYYNTITERFVWEATFDNQITEGFTLAVNEGRNPKGIAGELALVYVDLTHGAPVVTAYGYNGLNAQTSFRDGEPAGGTQAPTRIATSEAESGFVNSVDVIDANGGRTIRLDLDASAINAFGAANGMPEWEGLRFGEEIGMWFHSNKDLSSSYNAEGFLSSWDGDQGYFDGSGRVTTPVPTPATFALSGVGLGMLASRRVRNGG